MTPDPSSHPNDHSVQALLAAARAGSAEALGELLEKFRPYLQFLANQEADPALRSKRAPSDVVQDTFLAAYQEFPQFRGQTAQELAGWLKQILLNTQIDGERHIGAAKRDVGREVPLDDDDSRNTLPEQLVSPEPPPDQALIAAENTQRGQALLERLPDRYAQVILLRVRDGLSFEEIGRRLGLTPDGARMLYNRAMEKLRELLKDTDDK